MKLVSFRHAGKSGFGLVDGDDVVDLTTPDTLDLKTALALGLPSPDGRPRLPLGDVDLAPVIPDPAKIFCIGVNYLDHRQEMGRAETGYPTIFLRFADTLTAHGAPLVRPRESERFDYEGELAVIIGAGGRRIPEAEAMNHVAGYACFNDGSVRDWQNHTTQFTPGKNFPATGGFGPWMVTADEVPDPSALTLTTRLNGQVVQNSTVDLLIFPIPALIAYISSFTALSPGDVISTGTPGGVGARRDPPLWMKDGDTVEVEISGVGTLRNTVADDA